MSDEARELTIETDRLQDCVTALTEAVESLEARLGPVLMKESGDENVKRSVDTRESQLGETLQTTGNRIEVQRDCLAKLIERLAI